MSSPERKHEVEQELRQARNLTWGSIAKSLFAGGVAGGISRTAVAPLERLKILMQVQGNEKVYTGVWQGLVRMGRDEGIRGMFRGNWTNCIRIVPNSAVKFLTYEQLSRRISHYLKDHGGDGQMTPFLRLAAGAGAGIVGMSATYPLDMVRGRLTVQGDSARHYAGIWDATRQIVKQEGIMTLWKGWLPSVIGVIPYVGLNFAVYETLKDVVLNFYELRDERDLSVVTRLACGAVAGTTGQTVAYPLDVVRRRMQVSGWQGSAHLHRDDKGRLVATNPQTGASKVVKEKVSPTSTARELHAEGRAIAYRGMVDCFVRTIKEEGVQALFKGLWPNYIKVVPSIAIAFVTYEKLKEMLGVQLRISS